MSLNIDNEDEIFKFLLDKNDNNIDSDYLKIINEIEYDVKNKLKNKKFSNLYCVNINFENFDWINEKIVVKKSDELEIVVKNLAVNNERRETMKHAYKRQKFYVSPFDGKCVERILNSGIKKKIKIKNN